MSRMHRIQNQEALTDIFGHWPSFHDAEILSLVLDRGDDDRPSLEAQIHLWRMTDQIDAKGYYVLTDHRLATLRFDGIVLEYLSGFNGQNVLSDLEITEVDPQAEAGEGCRYQVIMNASFGCEALFQCRTISVVSAMPFQPPPIPSQ